MITPFHVYELFNALKLHFTSDYNAFKYNFQTKASEVSFNKRKDKGYFERIAYKYKHKDEVIKFLLSNIVKNPHNFWIGKCNRDNYDSWKKINDGLSYHFEQQCLTLKQRYGKIENILYGEFSELVNEYLSEEVSLETLTIFNSISGFLKIMNNPLIEDTVHLVEKYEPFLNIDKNKYAEIAYKIFNED